MLKKLFRVVRVIASELAVAFFFVCVVIVSIHFTIGNEINTFISLIKVISIEKKIDVSEEAITFDQIKKRLANYPSYGAVWATLKIPKIGVEDKIYHGDTLDLLKYGIGHFVGSYFPGEGGSIIFSAHNSKQHFKYLPKLVKGDEIIVKATYGTFTYQITSYEIMAATKLEKYEVQSQHEELLLYTCYPVDGVGYKSKRYVVFAKLVGVEYAK